VRGGAENPRDGSRQLVPRTGLERKLLAPFGGEPVQRRVERALFHLQYILGVDLDGPGDGVAVGR